MLLMKVLLMGRGILFIPFTGFPSGLFIILYFSISFISNFYIDIYISAMGRGGGGGGRGSVFTLNDLTFHEHSLI